MLKNLSARFLFPQIFDLKKAMSGGLELYVSYLNLTSFFSGGEMLQVDPAHIFFQMCGSPFCVRSLHCEVQEAFHLSAGVAPLLAIRSSEAWI